MDREQAMQTLIRELVYVYGSTEEDAVLQIEEITADLSDQRVIDRACEGGG